MRPRDLDADPERDFRTAADDDPADLIALYEQTCERSREAVASVASLDALTVGTSSRTGRPFNVRWVLPHLIEETARHAGHPDLLREAIDGATGEPRRGTPRSSRMRSRLISDDLIIMTDVSMTDAAAGSPVCDAVERGEEFPPLPL